MRHFALMIVCGSDIAVPAGAEEAGGPAREQGSPGRADTVVARLDLTIGDESPISPAHLRVDRRGGCRWLWIDLRGGVEPEITASSSPPMASGLPSWGAPVRDCGSSAPRTGSASAAMDCYTSEPSTASSETGVGRVPLEQRASANHIDATTSGRGDSRMTAWHESVATPRVTVTSGPRITKVWAPADPTPCRRGTGHRWRSTCARSRTPDVARAQFAKDGIAGSMRSLGSRNHQSGTDGIIRPAYTQKPVQPLGWGFAGRQRTDGSPR